MTPSGPNAESERLALEAARVANWKRWGPYLADRQWGTVREDYSENGDCWTYFPHDHARSRAYRWGEDGILGITDRECRLCLALALWNGQDPILKERFFGLTGPEGNHGEDVKDEFFYLDSTPTHSYMRGLYKYPLAEFPYRRLVEENARRGRDEPEFELADSGVFDQGYFDVQVEYAKNAPDDILVRITVTNRSARRAPVHVLPTLWFRNTWSWGGVGEGHTARPSIDPAGELALRARHPTLGVFDFSFDRGPGGRAPEVLFTENDTNSRRLFGSENRAAHVKDAFHDRVVKGDRSAVNPGNTGTKAAPVYVLDLAGGERAVVRARLSAEGLRPAEPLGAEFERVFELRASEADSFYDAVCDGSMDAPARHVARQAYAGLLWSKQFYHYSVREWLDGDPAQPNPPASRLSGRNSDWGHLYNRDIISMPDKWEYPWYAAWDTAFHMVAMARVDPQFAKDQLVLFLREWYMHPSGQIPAYEFAFGDVNPPVHAWACWRVYKMTGPRGQRDRMFLARVFQKLLINFTWWVNRKDPTGRNLFSGGFLGMDNVGVFDRSMKLPAGVHLDQADGTAWMAFYCGTMLSMALELAQGDPVYEDVASKFFEHYVAIVDAMNHAGGTGLWDDEDGFYYDQLWVRGVSQRLKVRSMVGLVPLLTVEVFEQEAFAHLTGFWKRARWFMQNRADLSRHISYMNQDGPGTHDHRLLAVPSRDRLRRMLAYLFDEAEFLSPYGVRSVSKFHDASPFSFRADGREHRVAYSPGESTTELFGGNSNWRGPVWMPLNFLIVEALERYHHFYGDAFTIECPARSGRMLNLQQAAAELRRRLCSLFLPAADGSRPCHGGDVRFARDPHWKDLVLFHEYFHAESGKGLGATHQTGWTALVATLLREPSRPATTAQNRRAPAEILPAAAV